MIVKGAPRRLVGVARFDGLGARFSQRCGSKGDIASGRAAERGLAAHRVPLLFQLALALSPDAQGCGVFEDSEVALQAVEDQLCFELVQAQEGDPSVVGCDRVVCIDLSAL